MLSHEFHVPARLHAAHSLLGRAIQLRLKDPRQAEAVYLLTAAAVALGLVLAHFGVWTWLQPEPGSRASTLFWAGQGASGFLFALTCLLGFAPSVTASIRGSDLILRQGNRQAIVPHRTITAYKVTTALRYWRDYAPFEVTQPFLNRIPPEVLIVHAHGVPYVLGLPKADRDMLLCWLDRADVRETAAAV